MIPKSTLKLNSGDYCLITRDDGKFVPFVYIEKQGDSRSYFYGGIVDLKIDTDSNNGFPKKLKISDHALLHIKCYHENETPIIGNMIDSIDPKLLKKIKKNLGSTKIGATSSVWGHKTIMKYANNI